MYVFPLHLENETLLSSTLAAFQFNIQQGRRQMVYALLTDLRQYTFYSYNGVHFTRSPTRYIKSESTHLEFLRDMAEGTIPNQSHPTSDSCLVSERLFGVLLKGYIDFLQAVIDCQDEPGDVRHCLLLIIDL
jgi:hypothetical protein